MISWASSKSCCPPERGLNPGSQALGGFSILRKLGFEVLRERGSHQQFRDTRGRCITVPAYKGRDIAPPLLRQIVKNIGMTEEEFLSFR